MHHHQCCGGAELDGEVAVAHGVERVLRDAFEAEFARHHRPVQRIAGAGQRRGAQRQAVDAAAAIDQAFGVASEHLDIGQQVVAEGHGLGHLQMGEAGHEGVRMRLGDIHQAGAQTLERSLDAVDGVAQPQPDVGCYLVVATAAGVQAFAGVAHELRQARLDVQVHVLQFQLPVEAAGGDVSVDLRHAALDVRQVLRADDVLRSQHAGVGEGSLDVKTCQTLVKSDRSRVTLHQRVDRLGKEGRPGLLLAVEG